MTRDAIIAQIQLLKHERPPNWQRSIRRLIHVLEYDRYATHVFTATEAYGRPARHSSCPWYDDMSDESEP